MNTTGLDSQPQRYGLRRESREAREAGATPLSEAGDVSKAVSPLRFATAVHILVVRA